MDYTSLVSELRHYFSEVPLVMEAADAIESLISDCNMYSKAVTDEHNRAAKLAWEKDHCWIPVTEEPPLKVGDDGYNGYLVYANGYYEVADYTTDKFDNVPYFRVDGEYEPDVTHWMPLPDPPKEETE
jgi:hypothetical protein